MFLSGLVNPVEEITLQATNNRRTVKRLSRSVTTDEHGQAKVSELWFFSVFSIMALLIFLFYATHFAFKSGERTIS